MTPGLMCIAGLRNEREADHFSWSSISRVLMIQRCLCQCQFPTIRRRETLVFPGNLNINCIVPSLGGRISRVGGPCEEI